VLTELSSELLVLFFLEEEEELLVLVTPIGSTSWERNFSISSHMITFIVEDSDMDVGEKH
jgi:hypothetical protein